MFVVSNNGKSPSYPHGLRMPMSPAEIKKELKDRGITQVMIARSVKPKVSATQLNRVVWGRDKSPRLREAIARMLGTTVDQIWPPSLESKTRHAA